WFVTQENIANAVQQQMTRFTHGADIGNADGIQPFPYCLQLVVNIAWEYFESL
ncbi:hypothetical protein L9F63_026409, partial [Diploptera punctata]